MIQLSDQLQPDAKEAVRQLQSLLKTVGMVSGDISSNNHKIAGELGISTKDVFAEQTPEQKLQQLQGRRGTTIMVGNGYNDSLALAGADIGVAVVGANQQAHEAADVSLRVTGLRPLVAALKLSKQAMLKIRWAFAFAVTFNLCGLTAAALGYMHPVVAAILMPLSSLTVLCLSVIWTKSAQN